METPDQQAENGITTVLDSAIGTRTPDTDARLRAAIWQLLREEQLRISRASEEEG